MRVVLFCGGLGMRLRDYSESIPKPMVPIGYRPLIWWVMKYYAHFGHRDFVLCLGYKGDVIKDYFLNYNECRSNDFVLSQGGQRIELLQKDIEDWRITFVDTGMHANIGERLMAVRSFLRDEDVTFTSIEDVKGADTWVNGGFFVFRREIFDYMQPGEELVVEPFQRLVA